VKTRSLARCTKHVRHTSEASDVVLDANVLVRLVVPGDYREQALALWDRISTGHEPCLIPRIADRQLLRRLDGRVPEAHFLGDYPLTPLPP
jgi:predicted nucleic acid-binding protein